MIELFTYRAESHSTSDDPSRYRPADEAERWPLGDPIERLKTHLIALGEWSDERHEALQTELVEQVRAAEREAEAIGTLGQVAGRSAETMFEDVFKRCRWHLRASARRSGSDHGRR